VLAVRGDTLKIRPVALLLAGGAALLAVPAAVAQTTPVPPSAPPAVAAPAPPPRLVTCRRPSTQAPPSQALLGALGVLRRPAKAEDALPATVLRLLTARGLAPVDPASARLLRTTPQGGKAWIVPVPDVGLAGFVPCGAERDPAEGVVVVATGGAPAGGGAAVPDLVRGRGAVSVDACAGPDRDMLGVSGVVPDGVGAAYLTAPDGTAVRADVVDNGYAFVVPAPRRPEQRYVVWTGGDGTPHVQPVSPVVAARRGGCGQSLTRMIRVTPGEPMCPAVVVVAPRRRRATRVPRLPRVPLRVPAQVWACPALPVSAPLPVPAVRPRVP
jgi:hypothetical protein